MTVGSITAKQIFKVKGSDITMQKGDITSSGHISSSQTVFGLSGSFGTGTTIVTDNITTDGNISASGTLSASAMRVMDLTAARVIKVKGSDITLQSGNITASGNISSSETIFGLSGSFGTGTTTITDKIQTDGSISASGAVTASGMRATEARIETIQVQRTLKIKGSDITLQSGDISMSGALIATGSITTDGNISAGTGATGSFDHIITTNDTIEFRNHQNRDEVLGFAKFDPVEGLTVHSASYADNQRGPSHLPNATVAMPKIANVIKKTNGTLSKIGGVEFDNKSDIVPKSHMGSATTIRVLPGDFFTNGTFLNRKNNTFATTNDVASISGSSLITTALSLGTYPEAFVQIPVGSAVSNVISYGSLSSGNANLKTAISLRKVNFITGVETPLAYALTNAKGGNLEALAMNTGSALAPGTQYTASIDDYLIVRLMLPPSTPTAQNSFRGMKITYTT